MNRSVQQSSWLMAFCALFVGGMASISSHASAYGFRYESVDREKVQLGRLLFFDKVLSGNKNISCATCHHPSTNTGDGLSLPVGEGGIGTGGSRMTGSRRDGVLERVPRNSPAIFNLGFAEFSVFFHDGRVAGYPERGMSTPAGDIIPAGLDNALAAQAMFPVTSPSEMAGQRRENPQAVFAEEGDLGGLWEFVAGKVAAIPAYASWFQRVYGIAAEQITMVHIANAIAAYEGVAFRADNSPYDRFLNGDSTALTAAQKRGFNLFQGKGDCISCHRGKFQTDHGFHAIAMPQIGPGKGAGIGKQEDIGRGSVTGNADDDFKFRTPTLRNVALTAPYGHAGTYRTLKAVVEHHAAPLSSLERYDPSQVILPLRADLKAKDLKPAKNPAMKRKIAAANELQAVNLTQQEIHDLVAFLHALTDPASIDLRDEIPSSVPSGLPVSD